MRVSKDGGQSFFEIGDSPEEQDIASQKGYKSYMTLTKNGSDHYDIEATPEQLHIAEQKGYMSPEAHQNLNESQAPRQAYPKSQSFAQGATSTMTMGFDDELSGVGSGIKAAVQGKNPIDAYRNQRDAYRLEKAKSESDNPWSYAGGSFAGGMALPGGAATKGAGWLKAMASGAKAGAVQGAFSGVGDAESVRDIPKSSAIGAAKGSVYGAAGGAAAKGVSILMSRSKAPSEMPNLDQLTDAETRKVAGGAADNGVGKRPGEIANPMGKFVMRRDVTHNGENLKHEVYKLNGELVHSLVDESGRRMAEIRGKMMKYKGKEGFAIHNSASAPGSKGHGKKLYDLTLDTHNQVFSDTSLSPKGSRPVYEEHYPNQPGVEVTPDTRGTRDRFQVDLKNKESFRQKGQIKDFDSEDGKSLEEINKVKWLTRLGLHGQPVDDFDNYSIPGQQRPSPPVPDQRLQRMESGVERAGWILKHTGDLDIAIKHLESTMGMSRLEAIQAVKTAVSNRESQAIHPKVQNAINREAQTQHTPRSLLEEDIAQGFQDGYRPAEVFNSFRGRDGISDAELRAIIGRRAGGS